jgi:hypothetical protein
MVLVEIAINKGDYADLDWILTQFVRYGLDLNQPLWGYGLPLAWVAQSAADAGQENQSDYKNVARTLIQHGAKVDLAIRELREGDPREAVVIRYRDKSLAFLQQF